MNSLRIFIILCLIFVSSHVDAQSLPRKAASVEENTQKRPRLPALNKSPRSLFLVKKAKIDNDVGEPVLYPSEKQAELLTNEKIYNKYRLQILDSHKADWNNVR